MQTIEYTDSLRQGTDKINANFSTAATNTISAATSLDASALGKIHYVSGTSSDYTVDLPTAVGNTGKTIIFKASPALTKVVTLAGVSGQNIDGDASRKMARCGSFTLMSDGTNWTIINEVGSWIPFTPVWTGLNADPTILHAIYFRTGKRCTYKIKCGSSGTSTASVTTRTVTAPFNAANIGVQNGIIQMVNNNGAQQTPGVVLTRVNSNVMDLYINSALGSWSSSSGNFVATLEITYEVE